MPIITPTSVTASTMLDAPTVAMPLLAPKLAPLACNVNAYEAFDFDNTFVFGAALAATAERNGGDHGSVPALTPTQTPMITPALTPTHTQIPAPTLLPTLAPPLAPTFAPPLAPTHAQPLASTLAPALAPALAPVLAPTHTLALAPALA